MINQQIYKYRKMMGLSQEELGHLLSVSRQTVSKWELGQTNPDIDIITQMTRVFNVTYEELIDGNGQNEDSTNLLAFRKMKYGFILGLTLMVLSILLFIVYLYIRTSPWFVSYLLQQTIAQQSPNPKLGLLYNFLRLGLPLIVIVMLIVAAISLFHVFVKRNEKS